MAKGNKRTIYLGLDYTDFTGGVTEVNRKMSLLDEEFKLAQQQAKNYGNETDELGLKQDYLRQKLELQAKKVEAAEKAHKEATETNKKSQREIDALEKKLLKEKTAYEKLKGQLQDAEKAQKEMNDTTKSFGDEIRGLASSLGIDINPAIENLASKFDGVSAEVGNLVLGVGAVMSALVSCSVELANYADDMLTLSSVTGLSTDELQKLEYASNFVDVSLETMSGAMTKLTSNMYAARNGSGEAAEAFNKLHIRVADSRGVLRDANDVFYEAIDKLGKISNETQRDALAMQIFGKSAKELNPLIEAGSERLKELGLEAEDMGLILEKGTLESAGKFKDVMDKMNEVSEKLELSLGTALIPMLTSLFTAISKIPVPVLQTIVVIATVIATIVATVKAIKSLTDTGKTIKNFFSTFDIAAHKTTLIILGVVAAIIAVIALIAVLAGKTNDVERAMTSVGDSMGKMTNTMNNAQANVYSAQQHASGTTNFRGGRTWVGEGGPELVELPAGSRITPEDKVGKTEYNTYYVTIDAKNVDEFNRIVELARRQRMAERSMA